MIRHGHYHVTVKKDTVVFGRFYLFIVHFVTESRRTLRGCLAESKVRVSVLPRTGYCNDGPHCVGRADWNRTKIVCSLWTIDRVAGVQTPLTCPRTSISWSYDVFKQMSRSDSEADVKPDAVQLTVGFGHDAILANADTGTVQSGEI